MRSLVSVVAAVATVMHLTFGCCLHAADFAADQDGCCGRHEHAVAATAAPAACHDDGCKSHGGDHDEDRATGLRAGAARGVHHDCTPCSCAASVEGDRPAPDHSAALPMAAAWLAASTAAPQGHRRSRDRGGAPPTRSGHPLHERMLV